MPRIPTPKVGVPSAPSVRQNIQAPAAAFGMGTAQSIQRLGDMGQQISAELQQRRNVVEVQNAYLAATKALDSFLHDPESGIYNRKGGNAAGSFDAVKEKLPELEAEFTANLTGVQRELFERQWRQSTLPAVRGAMNHESREINSERAQALQALVTQNAERMAMNYTDMEAVDTFAQNARNNIIALADMAGWSPQHRELKEKEVMSQAYAAVFEKYFATDDIDGATAVLNRYGDQIHDRVKTKLRNDLRAKQQAIFIQDKTDEIITQFGDNEVEAMAFVRSEFQGDVQDKLERRVASRFNEIRQHEQRALNQRYHEDLVSIYKAPSRSAALAIADRATDPKIQHHLYRAVESNHPIRVATVDRYSVSADVMNIVSQANTERQAIDFVYSQVPPGKQQSLLISGIERYYARERRLQQSEFKDEYNRFAGMITAADNFEVASAILEQAPSEIRPDLQSDIERQFPEVFERIQERDAVRQQNASRQAMSLAMQKLHSDSQIAAQDPNYVEEVARDVGIYKAKDIEELRKFVDSGGYYSQVQPNRVASIMRDNLTTEAAFQAVGLERDRNESFNAEALMKNSDFYKQVVDRASDLGKDRVSDKDLQNIIMTLATKGSVTRQGFIFTSSVERTVAAEQQEKGHVRDMNLVATLKQTDGEKYRSIASVLNTLSTEPVNDDIINRVLQSDIDGENYVAGADKVMAFYNWTQSQPHNRVSGRVTEDGINHLVEIQITPEQLQNPEIVRKLYEIYSKGRR